MKLSDKLQLLRRERGYSQEELASVCGVSRQSISKWEADISLPETEKLIVLSRLFGVTVDVLLKDELSVNGMKEVHVCGENALKERRAFLYEGILIKESLEDENVLDHLSVNKLELWNTGGKPKYWTVLYFISSDPRLPRLLSQALLPKKEGEGG